MSSSHPGKLLSLVLGLLLAGTTVLLANCRVDVPPDAIYGCATDVDCGGGGYVCVTPPEGPRYCCLSATETCDGRDNDCNGVVDDIVPIPCYTGAAGTKDVGVCHGGLQRCTDTGTLGACEDEVVPGAERCNLLDDNCNGQADEDPTMCGEGRICYQGGCLTPQETLCTDGEDNDGDTFTDCADPDCNTQSCGTGCMCLVRTATEIDCGDGQNNDPASDTAVDCADTDCNNQSCGTGCRCTGGVATESDCSDGQNNDGDSGADCADTDCNTKSCGGACVCEYGTETRCGDGFDNDADTAVDCADSNCDGLSCGTGCLCSGGARHETNCSDGQNNDGESGADCADVDCNGQSCGAGCTCQFGAETSCNDGFDNDGDGPRDCADSDCNGQSCGTGCTCAGGVKKEINCNDGQDNDGDGRSDCLDTDCHTSSCGAGCVVCQGTNHEIDCADNQDNDGDGPRDCADTADCPAGTACNAAGNKFCSTGGQCR